MKMHPSITAERIIEAIDREVLSLDNPGFCLACGEDADDVEPDARDYECMYCGEFKVYGAQEVLLAFDVPKGSMT